MPRVRAGVGVSRPVFGLVGVDVNVGGVLDFESACTDRGGVLVPTRAEVNGCGEDEAADGAGDTREPDRYACVLTLDTRLVRLPLPAVPSAPAKTLLSCNALPTSGNTDVNLLTAAAR